MFYRKDANERRAENEFNPTDRQRRYGALAPFPSMLHLSHPGYTINHFKL